jgi:Asp/Glu/hydantoin racemase
LVANDAVSRYDGFLVAAGADHLLVPLLRSYVGRKPVAGIFQASLSVALHLVLPGTRFGIVTTGKQYEAMLADGVAAFLGGDGAAVFGGAVASGVSADEVGNEAVVRSKVAAATRRLVEGGQVSVVCLGGAILVNCERWVREACVDVLGEENGMNVRIVDQMLAGVTTLDGLARMAIAFDY